jgi:hypothetical protein
VRLRRRRHGLHSFGPSRRGRFKAGRLRTDRRHPWLRRSLIGLAVLVVLVAGAGGAGWFYLQYRLDNVPRLTIAHGVLTSARSGAPYDVLLVESPPAAGASDLVVVARVVPADRAVELLAIPGSLRLRLPAAKRPLVEVGSLGPSALAQVVTADLHVPIEHVAEVGSAGVPSLVDAMGGVYLQFPTPLADQGTGLRVDAVGCQRISGAEASKLVKSTTPYYYQSRQWQQWMPASPSGMPVEEAVLAALLVRAGPSLGNPLGIVDLLGSVGSALHVDSTWGGTALMGAAGQLAGVPPSSIGSETLPTAAAGGYRGISPASDAAISAWLALGVTAKAPAPAAPGAAPWQPVPCSPS